MTFISKTFAAAALIATVGAGFTAASAQDVSINKNGEQYMVVDHSDLNLETQEGLNTLERRVKKAARKVCGYNHNTGRLSDTLKAKRCASTAQENAIASVTRTGTVRIVARTVEPRKPR